MFSGKYLPAVFLDELSKEIHYELNPNEANLLKNNLAS